VAIINQQTHDESGELKKSIPHQTESIIKQAKKHLLNYAKKNKDKALSEHKPRP